MNIIGNLLGQVLRVIVEFVPNYGLSIVIFTILVKTLLLPLTIKQTKSTKAMQDIQPKIKEIQDKYKNKPEKQQQEIMALYKEANVNPMAGCLPLLIQMPILIGLFSVLREPVARGVFTSETARLAADTGFLWIKSLDQQGGIILGLLSGISAYIMQLIISPPDQQQQGTMKTMSIVMAGMSFWWSYKWQAGLGIYWTVSNLYTIAQYYLIMNPLKAKMANSKEDVVDGKSSRFDKK